MRVDVTGMLLTPAVQREVAGVVIANPNAPTGIGLPLAEIEQLLQMHPAAGGAGGRGLCGFWRRKCHGVD
jgi:histidinol-phosphate/aromatic aminotransferase/cobyric acid decarboxylase-like protein